MGHSVNVSPLSCCFEPLRYLLTLMLDPHICSYEVGEVLPLRREVIINWLYLYIFAPR